MTEFLEAARLDDLPAGTGKPVMVDGKQIALFNVAGQIYAIDDTCPHAGGSLGIGKLDGAVVTCRWHGMKIDVVRGCFPASGGFAVASYPVIVLAGKILVKTTGPIQTAPAGVQIQS
jgi:3-phenylpropionate/trans-cinnamate dioxygenase ferredoxin subunit